MSPHKIIFLLNDVPCFCLMMMYYVIFCENKGGVKYYANIYVYDYKELHNAFP